MTRKNGKGKAGEKRKNKATPAADELLLRWAWLASAVEDVVAAAEGFAFFVENDEGARKRVDPFAVRTFVGALQSANVMACVPRVLARPE